MMNGNDLTTQFLENNDENERALLSHFQRLSQEVDPLHWRNLAKISGNMALQAFAVTAFAPAVVVENSSLIAASTISVNALLNSFFAQPGFSDFIDFCERPSIASIISSLPRLAISALSSIIYVEIAVQNPWLFAGLSEAWDWAYLLPYMAFSWKSSELIMNLIDKLLQPINIREVYFNSIERKEEIVARNKLEKLLKKLLGYYLSLSPEDDDRNNITQQIKSFFQKGEGVELDKLNDFLKALNTAFIDHSLQDHDNEAASSHFRTYFKPVATMTLWLLCSTATLGYFAETSQSFEEQGETGTFYQLCTLAVMGVMSSIVTMVSANISEEFQSLIIEKGYKETFLWKHEYLRWATIASISAWTIWACFSAGLAVALAKGYITKDIYFLDADLLGAVIFNVYAFPIVWVAFVMCAYVISFLNKERNNEHQSHYVSQDFSVSSYHELTEDFLPGSQQLHVSDEAFYIHYMKNFVATISKMDLNLQIWLLTQIVGEENFNAHQEAASQEENLPSLTTQELAVNSMVFIANGILAAFCFSEKEDLLDFSSERLMLLGGMLAINFLAQYLSSIATKNNQSIHADEHVEMKVQDEAQAIGLRERLLSLGGPLLPLLLGAGSLLLTEVAVLYFKGVLKDMPREFVTVPVCAFAAAHTIHAMSLPRP